MELEIILPLAPITKKNSQQLVYNPKLKRPLILPSPQYIKYEKEAKKMLTGLIAEPIDYPVNIRYMFYMPTRRNVDLTNLEEAIDDVLVHSGIIADDNSNILVGHDGSRVKHDKENPRTEIYIEEIM